MKVEKVPSSLDDIRDPGFTYLPYGLLDEVTNTSCVLSVVDGAEVDGGAESWSPKANWYPKAANADSRRGI